jgi:hypothetical protein
MLLDEGKIAFAGSPAEFAASALPAVACLTRAENGTRIVETYIPDPWDKKRRPKSLS